MNTLLLNRENIVEEVRIIRKVLITTNWTFSTFLEFLKQSEDNTNYKVIDDTIKDFLYDHYEMITSEEVERLVEQDMEMYDYILELDMYLVEFCKLLY